ncbi:hypothetical protein K450DRAFT_262327 [Umbelopsis ramanniana AG]|uniref:BTB domain-containing protein n=1 Tax=Umbelopsis ramanniana AG TaxID=1314678 RepID=A0AAD5E2K2_UMBRA|nr:uncharacterized protein K450DRAFT_262327 [Umbelopsis ramanniana AG]KAI8575306.1 hypothetical protein K450DRAFT_262327 [Umbelopsis ramanniana AG]
MPRSLVQDEQHHIDHQRNMTPGNANDLMEQTEDGQLESIPAPFVAHALKRLAPTYFDNQEYADCELRLEDGHFLWANEFFLTFSSKYFVQVLESKHDEDELHPDLCITTHNNVSLFVITLPIDPLHRRILRDMMFAVYRQEHFRWLQQLNPAQFVIATQIMETLGFT